MICGIILICAGGVLHFDGFGPVYLVPMPGGRAADRARDVDDVTSLNCAAGAPGAGGGFLGEARP